MDRVGRYTGTDGYEILYQYRININIDANGKISGSMRDYPWPGTIETGAPSHLVVNGTLTENGINGLNIYKAELSLNNYGNDSFVMSYEGYAIIDDRYANKKLLIITRDLKEDYRVIVLRLNRAVQ